TSLGDWGSRVQIPPLRPHNQALRPHFLRRPFPENASGKATGRNFHCCPMGPRCTLNGYSIIGPVTSPAGLFAEPPPSGPGSDHRNCKRVGLLLLSRAEIPFRVRQTAH